MYSTDLNRGKPRGPERTDDWNTWCVQDVEGAELAVIESIDWSRVSFDVIAVEAHGFNSSKEMRIAQILEQHGYSRQGYHDGANQWYVSAQRQMLMSNR